MFDSLSPAGSRQRALFYRQSSTLLNAGFPLISALEHLSRNPTTAQFKSPILLLLQGLHDNLTFAESLERLQGWSSGFDIALIRAGEQSGTLDRALAALARHHESQANNLQALLREAIYPALVLHVALFIVPLPRLIQTGQIGFYLLQSIGTLLALYSVGVFIAAALRPDRSPSWQALIERVLVHIPVWGSARADIALARLAGSLHALLSAGILVTKAWPLAAHASGSPTLIRVVDLWEPLLLSGSTPAELIASSGAFPDFFASAYATGEVSGRLDEQLRSLEELHETEGFRKLSIVSRWCPRLLYGVVAIWIAVQIFTMAGGYVGTLNQLLGD
jgi:type IV pilus assembly protein PilC